MPSVRQTSDADLRRISKERGKDYDPEKHIAWCGECGAPLSGTQLGSGSFAVGIMHWPDCSCIPGVDESMIRFREVG